MRSHLVTLALLIALSSFGYPMGAQAIESKSDPYAYSLALGDEKTPTLDEVSPGEWRREQLVAADKSDEIMRRAQKQPGRLAQDLVMQTNYDGNDKRAFRLIFGR